MPLTSPKVMVLLLLWVVSAVLLWVKLPNEIVTAPALTFVFIFMARPPYEVVTSRVLVTGLWPPRNTVAIKVSP
jgi:hypothetical protein